MRFNCRCKTVRKLPIKPKTHSVYQSISRVPHFQTLKMYICLVLFPVMTFSGQNEMESAETRLHLETKSTIVKSYVLRKTSLKYQPTEHQKYYRRSAEQLKYFRRY